MKSTSKNQFAFNLVTPVKLQRDPNERALRLRQVSQLTGLGRSMTTRCTRKDGSRSASSWASGLWDGWRAKCATGWRLELKPAVLISVANDQVTTAPLATLLSHGKH